MFQVSKNNNFLNKYEITKIIWGKIVNSRLNEYPRFYVYSYTL